MKLIRSKNLRILTKNEGIFLYNSLYGNLCKASKDWLKIINFFKQPQDPKDFRPNGNYLRAINKLKEYKFLVATNKDEYDEIHQEFRRFVAEAKKGKFITNLRLNTSENCNCACDYCFVGKINSQYPNKNLGQMDWAVAQKALKNFYQLARINKNKEVAVRFFGGEPLLNAAVVFKSLELASLLSKRYGIKTKYLINTNCTIMNDEISGILKKYKTDIIVSLDGLEKINDSHRVLRSGQGTFDLIMKNIKILQKKKNNIIISTVITDLESCRQLKKFIKHLMDSGIKSIGVNYEQRYSKVEREKVMDRKIANTLIEAKRYALKNGISLHGFWELPYLKLTKGSLSYCGGIGRELSIDYVGNVYPCSAIKIKLGNVNEILKISSKKVYLKIISRIVGRIKGCKGCEIEAMCGGGCAAEALSVYHDFYKHAPDCDLRKILTRSLVLEDKAGVLMRQRATYKNDSLAIDKNAD